MTTGHSVLQVPVPGLEPFVRSRTEHYDTDYLSADPAFTHAHVTALGPFLPEVDDEAAATVAAIVAETPAFSFTLERIATFPNGIIHLVPSPTPGSASSPAGWRLRSPSARRTPAGSPTYART